MSRDRYTIDVLEDATETRMVLGCFMSRLGRVPDAKWTKDGQPLEEIAAADRRVRIHATNVTIDPVLPEDEGVYRCKGGAEWQLTSTFNHAVYCTTLLKYISLYTLLAMSYGISVYVYYTSIYLQFHHTSIGQNSLF